MSDPFDSNLLRILQEAETLADAGGSEELLSQVRENIEALLILAFYTGTGGTATADPPDDATGVFYDEAAVWDDDEHNNRTLVLIDGLAAGNIYTIDDTIGWGDDSSLPPGDSSAISSQLICTGDNLYADGVRSGDAYKVFYDIKRFTGHDHDAINSPLVALADSQVITAKIADDAVTQAKMANAAIGQAELKTSLQEQSQSIGTGTGYTFTLTGGQYCLEPQYKASSAASPIDIYITTSATTAYLGARRVDNESGSTHTFYCQHTYITASGEVNWLFILRDKITKNVIGRSFCPDHPCFGNGGKPLLIPHPFTNYDPGVHEIIVVNPSKQMMEDVVAAIAVDDENIPDRDIIDIVAEDYDLDDSVKPPWPTIPVTVGLPLGWEILKPGDLITPIKKIIPQPAGILTARLVPK